MSGALERNLCHAESSLTVHTGTVNIFIGKECECALNRIFPAGQCLKEIPALRRFKHCFFTKILFNCSVSH